MASVDGGEDKQAVIAPQLWPARSVGSYGPGSRWQWAAAAVAMWALVVGGAPLLGGPPGGDDAYYHAMRAQQHARCWLSGVVLPRWYPDLNAGLGGPEPRAYPLAPLTVGALFALGSDDGVMATSMATILIPVLAALVMLVVAGRRGVPPLPAALLAAAWAGSPYLVVALHERAALAEGWGLAVLPWVLATLLTTAPAKPPVVVRGALAYGLVLVFQLPLALMVALIAAGWHVARGSRRSLGLVAAAGATGLLLASVSWLPNFAAFWRLQGDQLVAAGYRWDENLLPGYAGSDPTLGSQLLLVLVAVALAGAVVALGGKAEARALGVTSLILVALCTPVAGMLYTWVPGLALLQFPWRWLGPAACLALLGALLTPRTSVRVAVVLALLWPLTALVASRWRLADGLALSPHSSAREAAVAATRYGVPPILPSLPAYLPRGVDLTEALEQAPRARQEAGRADPSGPRVWRFVTAQRSPGELLVPLLAGPGWVVEVDGQEVGWRPRQGLLSVPVPAGGHVVTAEQQLLVEDVAGLCLSFIGGLVIAAVWARRRSRTLG